MEDLLPKPNLRPSYLEEKWHSELKQLIDLIGREIVSMSRVCGLGAAPVLFSPAPFLRASSKGVFQFGKTAPNLGDPSLASSCLPPTPDVRDSSQLATHAGGGGITFITEVLIIPSPREMEK